MDELEKLKAEQAQVQAEFLGLQQQRKAHLQQAEQLQTESIELQGVYKFLQVKIDELTKETETPQEEASDV